MDEVGNESGRGRAPASSSTTTTTHAPIITTTSTAAGSHTTVVVPPQSPTPAITTTTTATHQLAFPVPSAPAATAPSDRRPSIRIRRHGGDSGAPTRPSDNEEGHGNRRRSFSAPQHPQQAFLGLDDDLEIRRQVTATPLQTLHEEGSGNTVPRLGVPPTVQPRSSRRPAVARQTSAISLRRPQGQEQREYEPEVVDVLDVIDPEVSTLTTLNNVQNSLFVPNLGWLYDRRPTYDLSQSPPASSDEETSIEQESVDQEPGEDAIQGQSDWLRPSANRLTTTNTISSVLTGISEGHNYAVLPHGAALPGWTAEEKAMLNDHVRHLLHSRRAKFKRGMRGFARYIRKPVGFLVTLYAFLLTFWGAAWVLFLIGWISVGGRQAYFIEICDQILTALFCVVGIGMAPWRAIDTYHMVYVAKYAHMTWRLRNERGLPALRDHNDLPSQPLSNSWETGEEKESTTEEPVLTAAQQDKLEYHQSKLAKSHTFYKPHETTTHHAFSVRLLIAIVVLLDCHSLFQMALGGTTWGIYYKDRPKALTAVILTCSISCNISAGITITVGDRRSRKKLVVEQMFRQGLTEEALNILRKEKGLVASGIGRLKTKSKQKTRT